jgi:hypothetical protein
MLQTKDAVTIVFSRSAMVAATVVTLLVSFQEQLLQRFKQQDQL